MAIILQKAGFNVLPSVDCPADDANHSKKKLQRKLKNVFAHLHMLSGEFGRRFESDEETSFPQYQFMEAKRRLIQHASDFNVFVWLSPDSKQIQ